MSTAENHRSAAGLKASELITGHPPLLRMLEYLEIPLGVRDLTVEQLCLENDINPALFLTLADLFMGHRHLDDPAYRREDLHIIIRYLKNNHQYYLDEKYPEIQGYIRQITEVNPLPEVQMIDRFFNDYFVEVIEHFDYETRVVFPYVLELDRCLSEGRAMTTSTAYSVSEYREHHNDIEEKLTDLKNLLVKYLPVKGDQRPRRKLLFSLDSLEQDLGIHSLIEDALLVPIVEKMEILVSSNDG